MEAGEVFLRSRIYGLLTLNMSLELELDTDAKKKKKFNEPSSSQMVLSVPSPLSHTHPGSIIRFS